MNQLPAPLRALIGWPEPHAFALARELRGMGVDVTLADDLAGYLSEPGYYHITYACLSEWRSFSAKKRSRLAGNTAVVVLGPGPASPADAATVAACLYLPAALSAADCVALLAAAHAALAGGWTFTEIAAANAGRLVFAGSEPIWSPPPAPAPASHSVNAIDGHAVSVGTGSRALKVEGAYVENQIIGAGAGLALGNVTVGGDVVLGNKLVQHADGDQVNINRGAAGAAKIEQTAGGDQINLNRAAAAPPAPAVCRAAAAPPAPAVCRACGAALTPPGKFCGKCGEQQ